MTTSPQPALTRRTILAGAAAIGGAAAVTAGLAACGDDPSPSGGPAAEPEPAARTVSVADVPVGGGTIVADQGVVVTQPTAGEFNAFSSTCPHQGCQVARVERTSILCTCHNSSFDAETGSVLSGPAQRGLTRRGVTVDGDSLIIA